VRVGWVPVRHHHLGERQPVVDGTHEAACRLEVVGEGGRERGSEGGREGGKEGVVLGGGLGQWSLFVLLVLPSYLERVIKAGHLIGQSQLFLACHT